MGRIYTYSPADVVFTVSDYIIPDITSISVEWDVDKFSIVRGIRGQNTRVRNLDTSCKITLSVLQTSISNQVFSQIVGLDGITEGGEMALANLSVSLKDNSGNSSFQSQNCYIPNYAVLSYNDTLQDRQWVIQCLDTLEVFIGGNQSPTQGIFS